MSDDDIGFFAGVGLALVSLAEAQITCGHRRIQYTARDYVHLRPDASIEAWLVQDILTLNIDELISKWPELNEPVWLGL